MLPTHVASRPTPFRSIFRKHEDWAEGVIVVTPARESTDDEVPPDEIFSYGADGKVRHCDDLSGGRTPLCQTQTLTSNGTQAVGCPLLASWAGWA